MPQMDDMERTRGLGNFVKSTTINARDVRLALENATRIRFGPDWRQTIEL